MQPLNGKIMRICLNLMSFNGFRIDYFFILAKAPEVDQYSLAVIYVF